MNVTEPGVYEMPNEEYQADPVPGGSLSHSGARKLLECPAIYRHWADGGSARTRAFDLGHVVHKLVLGAGSEVVVIDAGNYTTRSAREERDAAWASGKTPILRAEYDEAQTMAAAVLRNPVANALFDDGQPERSLFWRSDDVWLRARLDWLPDPKPGRRLIVPDLKTTKSAHPDYLRKALYDYGYYQQAAWYLDAITALGLGDDPAFVFVFVEKTAPYLVTICEPDADAFLYGRAQNAKAIDLYRQCRAADHWPGYADDVIPLALPNWAAYALENA
jgi:hypothetical protein